MSAWTCPQCRRSYPDRGQTIRCVCRAGGGARFVERGSIKSGPGTELEKILHAFGIDPKNGCSCRTVLLKMNRWGIDGCQLPDNHAWIVAQLIENAKRYSWSDTITAASIAVLNPSLLDVQFLCKMAYVGWPEALIDKAIRQAVAESAKM